MKVLLSCKLSYPKLNENTVQSMALTEGKDVCFLAFLQRTHKTGMFGLNKGWYGKANGDILSLLALKSSNNYWSTLQTDHKNQVSGFENVANL